VLTENMLSKGRIELGFIEWASYWGRAALS